MKDKTLPTAEEIRERIKKLLEETWESARSKSHGFQTYDSFFDYYKEIFELDEIIDLINNYVELRLKAIGEEIKEKESITQELLIDELEDKRIIKLSDLPEDIYYLHRKQTAEYLLDKFIIIDKDSI